MKQLVSIELKGRTFNEQMSSLLTLVTGMCEAKQEYGLGLFEWPTLRSDSEAGSIRELVERPPKPCALCGGPAHSGPCYVFPL